MKKNALLLFCLIYSAVVVFAQQQPTPAHALAMKWAKRMQDTLSLTNRERQKVFQINMNIYQDKTRVRQQYAGNMTVLTSETQKIENTRDSLYKEVLPINKYGLYIQKKRTLLTN